LGRVHPGVFEAVRKPGPGAVGGFRHQCRVRDGTMVKDRRPAQRDRLGPFEAVADQADGQLSDARAKAELAKRELERGLP